MRPLAPSRLGPRGGPLLMLVLLALGWMGLRAVWWDDPFAPPAAALGSPQLDYAGDVYAPQSVADPYLLAAPPAVPVAGYYGPEVPGGVPGGMGGWAPGWAPGWAGPGAFLPSRIVRMLHPSRLPAYGYARAPDLGLPAWPGLPPGTARAQLSGGGRQRARPACATGCTARWPRRWPRRWKAGRRAEALVAR